MIANISRLQWVTGLSIFIMLIFIAIDTDARGRGGGGRGGHSMSRGGGHSGGFSRSSASSHGSMRGRSASRPSAGRSSSRDRGGRDRPETRPDRPDRGDNISDRQNDRQDAARDRQNDRQDAARDIHDDREDWYDDRRRRVATAIVIGSVISAASWNSMSCARTSVVVDGITYWSCDGAWYQSSYSGGSVTYVVVDAPAGY